MHCYLPSPLQYRYASQYPHAHPLCALPSSGDNQPIKYDWHYDKAEEARRPKLEPRFAPDRPYEIRYMWPEEQKNKGDFHNGGKLDQPKHRSPRDYDRYRAYNDRYRSPSSHEWDRHNSPISHEEWDRHSSPRSHDWDKHRDYDRHRYHDNHEWNRSPIDFDRHRSYDDQDRHRSHRSHDDHDRNRAHRSHDDWDRHSPHISHDDWERHKSHRSHEDQDRHRSRRSHDDWNRHRSHRTHEDKDRHRSHSTHNDQDRDRSQTSKNTVKVDAENDVETPTIGTTMTSVVPLYNPDEFKKTLELPAPIHLQMSYPLEAGIIADQGACDGQMIHTESMSQVEDNNSKNNEQNTYFSMPAMAPVLAFYNPAEFNSIQMLPGAPDIASDPQDSNIIDQGNVEEQNTPVQSECFPETAPSTDSPIHAKDATSESRVNELNNSKDDHLNEMIPSYNPQPDSVDNQGIADTMASDTLISQLPPVVPFDNPMEYSMPMIPEKQKTPVQSEFFTEATPSTDSPIHTETHNQSVSDDAMDVASEPKVNELNNSKDEYLSEVIPAVAFYNPAEFNATQMFPGTPEIASYPQDCNIIDQGNVEEQKTSVQSECLPEATPSTDSLIHTETHKQSVSDEAKDATSEPKVNEMNNNKDDHLNEMIPAVPFYNPMEINAMIPAGSEMASTEPITSIRDDDNAMAYRSKTPYMDYITPVVPFYNPVEFSDGQMLPDVPNMVSSPLDCNIDQGNAEEQKTSVQSEFFPEAALPTDSLIHTETHKQSVSDEAKDAASEPKVNELNNSKDDHLNEMIPAVPFYNPMEFNAMATIPTECEMTHEPQMDSATNQAISDTMASETPISQMSPAVPYYNTMVTSINDEGNDMAQGSKVPMDQSTPVVPLYNPVEFNASEMFPDTPEMASSSQDFNFIDQGNVEEQKTSVQSEFFPEATPSTDSLIHTETHKQSVSDEAKDATSEPKVNEVSNSYKDDYLSDNVSFYDPVEFNASQMFPDATEMVSFLQDTNIIDQGNSEEQKVFTEAAPSTDSPIHTETHKQSVSDEAMNAASEPKVNEWNNNSKDDNLNDMIPAIPFYNPMEFNAMPVNPSGREMTGAQPITSTTDQYSAEAQTSKAPMHQIPPAVPLYTPKENNTTAMTPPGCEKASETQTAMATNPSNADRSASKASMAQMTPVVPFYNPMEFNTMPMIPAGSEMTSNPQTVDATNHAKQSKGAPTSQKTPVVTFYNPMEFSAMPAVSKMYSTPKAKHGIVAAVRMKIPAPGVPLYNPGQFNASSGYTPVAHQQTKMTPLIPLYIPSQFSGMKPRLPNKPGPAQAVSTSLTMSNPLEFGRSSNSSSGTDVFQLNTSKCKEEAQPSTTKANPYLHLATRLPKSKRAQYVKPSNVSTSRDDILARFHMNKITKPGYVCEFGPNGERTYKVFQPKKRNMENKNTFFMVN